MGMRSVVMAHASYGKRIPGALPSLRKRNPEGPKQAAPPDLFCKDQGEQLLAIFAVAARLVKRDSAGAGQRAVTAPPSRPATGGPAGVAPPGATAASRAT